MGISISVILILVRGKVLPDRAMVTFWLQAELLRGSFLLDLPLALALDCDTTVFVNHSGNNAGGNSVMAFLLTGNHSSQRLCHC